MIFDFELDLIGLFGFAYIDGLREMVHLPYERCELDLIVDGVVIWFV